MKIDRSRCGFTLIEILVAAAILVLLSAALVPLVVTQVQKGRVGRTQSESRNVSLAFLQYHSDTGQWPCSWVGATNLNEPLADYSCLYSNTSNLKNWNGPYLNKGVKVGNSMRMAARKADGSFEGIADAWGNPFQVILRKASSNRAGEAGGVILLLSSGPDLEITTSVDDAVAEKPTADDMVYIVTRKVN